MHIVLGLVLAIGLFCWWLSGNWYAWAVAFTAGAIPAAIFFFMLLLSIAEHDAGPSAAPWLVGCVVFAPAWWALTGIPYRCGPGRSVTPAAARAGSE